jgi:hypothetical protein
LNISENLIFSGRVIAEFITISEPTKKLGIDEKKEKE